MVLDFQQVEFIDGPGERGEGNWVVYIDRKVGVS